MPPNHASRVRIIGGRHRGRVVRFPESPGLRPTPDRVRETLFNWLGQDLNGASTLDLYTGSGVLSLESLSRGAALAVAVDRNPSLVRAVRATADAFGASGLETHAADALDHLERETRRFDVIFLDPPFDSDPWAGLLPRVAERLAPGGFVYVEAARRIDPAPGLILHRADRAGHVHYHLLRAQAG